MKLDILFLDNSHKLYQWKYGKPLQEHILCISDNTMVMVMSCKRFRYKEEALAPNVFDRLKIKLVMIHPSLFCLLTWILKVKQEFVKPRMSSVQERGGYYWKERKTQGLAKYM